MVVNWPSLVGLVVVSVPCIFLNLVVITGIYLDRNLHTITNMFIVSMAIADLLVGAVNVPLYVAEQNNSHPVEILLNCILGRSFTVFFVLASIAHLLVIAVDRYIAITFPLRHPTLMTKQKAFGCVLACWSLSIVTGFAPLLGWRKAEARDMRVSLTRECGYSDYMTFSYVMFMIILWFAIPVTTMFVLYGLIFSTASKQARKIRDTHRSVEHLHREFNDARNLPSRGKLSSSAMADHRKAAKVLCTIMGCFLICTLPGLVCLFIDYVTENGVSSIVANFTNLVAFLNSALNPLLYGIGNRQVRKSIKARFWRTKTISSPNVLSVLANGKKNSSSVTLTETLECV